MIATPKPHTRFKQLSTNIVLSESRDLHAHEMPRHRQQHKVAITQPLNNAQPEGTLSHKHHSAGTKKIKKFDGRKKKA